MDVIKVLEIDSSVPLMAGGNDAPMDQVARKVLLGEVTNVLFMEEGGDAPLQDVTSQHNPLPNIALSTVEVENVFLMEGLAIRLQGVGRSTVRLMEVA